MNKVKELGQVMTPANIVDYMLDDILCLTDEEKEKCLFLENSCGNGAFIKGLLERGVPKEHIYACDIDKEISEEITSLIPENNFYLGSIFDKEEAWANKFDFVIGNPPYVRIHNIEYTLKEKLKKNYKFCHGMFDLYMAFYEIGLKMLKEMGSLLYISSNSFVKSASGRAMRDYIEKNNLLEYYENFENSKKFENYSTYTCIIKLGKTKNTIAIPWKTNRERVGLSYTSLQNGIATLADKIFISNDFSQLEPDLIHPILKASNGEKKYVIVPPKTEEELQKYPKTYNYLLSFKDELLSRSLAGKTQWFEFGRSQGLVHMNEEKIAIGTVVPYSGIKLYRLPKEWYVYSGLYATSKDLDILEEELLSEQLLDYLVENGKPMSGEYVQIGSKLLKDY